MWRVERRSGARILLINPLPMHMNINSTCYLLTAPSQKGGAVSLYILLCCDVVKWAQIPRMVPLKCRIRLFIPEQGQCRENSLCRK